jgi:hypothetical protein
MSKPTIEQTKMGTEAIAFCIARTLIERDPSLKAPMRAPTRNCASVDTLVAWTRNPAAVSGFRVRSLSAKLTSSILR